MGESSDEGCVGEAASAVDPEFLSKVSYSRQSSKPPFLWNPYLWYLGLRSGVSLREKRSSGLIANRMLQAVIWMSRRMMDRYRYAWRERDKYGARMGSKPEHRWYSSNTTYLTQRLSWRVQGSGGGV